MSERYPQRPFTLPPGATEVIVVRHGASADAIPGEPFPLTEGHGDPPLSTLGEQQAQMLADRLSGEQFAALFVTGLERTVQTAAPLAERIGMEPEVVPDLREVRLGEWEAGEFRKRVHDRDPLMMRALIEERWDIIPGAETMESLTERVRRGMETIVERVGPDATGIAFLHGGVIGEVLRQATGSRPFAFIGADNCSISRIYVLPGGERWMLRTFNDVAHLNGAEPPA